MYFAFTVQKFMKQENNKLNQSPLTYNISGDIFMTYYIIGIKGTGCASLACFLKDIGFLVLGSDINEVFFTDSKLNEKEIKVLEYNENNLNKDYVYIIGHGAINSIEAKYVIKKYNM